MITVLFLHGMASSHECYIPATIQQCMPDAKVLTPDLSVDPSVAFPQIKEILAKQKVDVIIGHSLGGFMAQKFRGYRKILLNPSLGVSYFRLFMGNNKYKQSRYDGKKFWYIDDRICREYKALEKTEYDGLTKEEDDMTIGIFGRWDIMTRMSSCWFLQHYSHRIMIPGTHYPSNDSIRDYVVPAIRKLCENL